MLKVYFFAAKIFLDELKNRTMDQTRLGLSKYDRLFGPREVKQIYLYTSKGTQLRNFCSDFLVYNLGNTSDKKFEQLVAVIQEIPDIARDVPIECKSLAIFKREMSSDMSDDGADDPRSQGPDGFQCVFHEHATGEMCHNVSDLEAFNYLTGRYDEC